MNTLNLIHLHIIMVFIIKKIFIKLQNIGAIPRDYNAETRRIDRSNLVGVDMDDQPDIVSAEGYDGQIFIPEFHVNGLIG